MRSIMNFFSSGARNLPALAGKSTITNQPIAQTKTVMAPSIMKIPGLLSVPKYAF